jgi:ABC-type glycerol-3-phosphate transport system substrate-binding protein
MKRNNLNNKKMSRIKLFVAAAALLMVAASCGKEDDPKIKKEDVRIGWSLDGKDGDAFITKAIDRAKELKKLPTTGDVIFYVYNEDGRGSSKTAITIVVERLVDLIENYGVKHEPGRIYVIDFERADSIKAQQKLSLTIDLWSRKK